MGWTLVTVGAALALVSCAEHPFRSELDQADLRLERLTSGIPDPPRDGDAVVAGSTATWELSPDDCFNVSAAGAASRLGNLIRFEAPGRARIDLAPRPCSALTDHAPDGLTLEVVDVGDLHAVNARYIERWGLLALASGDVAPLGDTQTLLRHVEPAPGTPLLLFAEAPHLLDVGLHTGDRFAHLTHNLGDWVFEGALSATPRTGRMLAHDVAIGPGQVGSLRFEVGGASTPPTPVEGIAARDIVALHIAAAWGIDDDPGAPLTVVGLTAIALDGAGRRVDGVPVTWTSTGQQDPWFAAVDTNPLEGPAPYALALPGMCLDPDRREGPHRVSYEATFGDLAARLEGDVLLGNLAYEGDALAELQAWQEAHCPRPRAGCACASDGSRAGSALWALGLLALAGRRRRVRRP